MITVIGRKECGRCIMVKNLLLNKEIDFEYKLIEDVSQEENKLYTSMAQEVGLKSFPIIIKDNRVVDVKEV